MTTIKSSTLNFVREQAKYAEGFVDLAKTLNEIASNDAALKREKAALDKVKADRAAAEQELKNIQNQLHAANNQMVGAGSTLDRLSKDAAKVVGEAQSQAARLLADARAGADHITRSAEDALAVGRKQLQSLDVDVKTMQSNLESKKRELKELEGQHATLQRKHQALLAGLSALQGNL